MGRAEVRVGRMARKKREKRVVMEVVVVVVGSIFFWSRVWGDGG